jgi:hypothetical protein
MRFAIAITGMHLVLAKILENEGEDTIQSVYTIHVSPCLTKLSDSKYYRNQQNKNVPGDFYDRKDNRQNRDQQRKARGDNTTLVRVTGSGQVRFVYQHIAIDYVDRG